MSSKNWILGILFGLAVSSSTQAAVTIDFETNGSAETPGTNIVNGQTLDGTTFAGVATLTSNAASRPHLGGAAFDTTDGGVNDTGPANDNNPLWDHDLLVNSGNALIAQNNDFPTQTTPGIFDRPNDFAGNNAVFTLDFTSPVTLLSIDAIDVNGNMNMLITLFDLGGNSREYFLPVNWTGDVTAGFQGYETLDLTATTPQVGVGPGTPSSSVTTIGSFDPTNVIQMTIDIDGSGAVDNIVFIPEPATMSLLGLGSMILLRKRKKLS